MVGTRAKKRREQDSKPKPGNFYLFRRHSLSFCFCFPFSFSSLLAFLSLTPLDVLSSKFNSNSTPPSYIMLLYFVCAWLNSAFRIQLFATRILCCCMLYNARYSLHFHFTLFSRSQECQDSSSRESPCSTLASFQITRTKNMVFTAFRWNEKWKNYTRQLPLGARK